MTANCGNEFVWKQFHFDLDNINGNRFVSILSNLNIFYDCLLENAFRVTQSPFWAFLAAIEPLI
jgi:hypothetical protein